jgi:hypothetical protein
VNVNTQFISPLVMAMIVFQGCWLERPAERRTPGMPRWAVATVSSRMASSFWPAAARVVSIAATSPSLWGARSLPAL